MGAVHCLDVPNRLFDVNACRGDVEGPATAPSHYGSRMNRSLKRRLGNPYHGNPLAKSTEKMSAQPWSFLFPEPNVSVDHDHFEPAFDLLQ
jgi:hypothetical protein